jgi:hypothetical protein
MSATVILAILQAVLGAAPQLLALFDQAKSGTPVSAADVAAVLSQFNIDNAAFTAAIAAAEAAQSKPAPSA